MKLENCYLIKIDGREYDLRQYQSWLTDDRRGYPSPGAGCGIMKPVQIRINAPTTLPKKSGNTLRTP